MISIVFLEQLTTINISKIIGKNERKNFLNIFLGY